MKLHLEYSELLFDSFCSPSPSPSPSLFSSSPLLALPHPSTLVSSPPPLPFLSSPSPPYAPLCIACISLGRGVGGGRLEGRWSGWCLRSQGEDSRAEEPQGRKPKQQQEEGRILYDQKQAGFKKRNRRGGAFFCLNSTQGPNSALSD